MEILFGSIKIVPTFKVEGDKVYMGGYSISLDQQERETSRTKNTWNVILESVPEYCLPLIRGERL